MILLQKEVSPRIAHTWRPLDPTARHSKRSLRYVRHVKRQAARAAIAGFILGWSSALAFVLALEVLR